MAAPHDQDATLHPWVATGVPVARVGKGYQQHGQVYFCPECGAWGQQITLFLDGDFFPTAEAASARQRELNRETRAARRAWKAEHYPDVPD